MKNIGTALLAIIMSMRCSGQAETNNLKAHYLKIYNQSLAYNDVSTAISALHGYLAMDNSLKYKDTLSMLYFSSKSYVSSLMLAEEVYKADKTNILAMARAAECYDELGDPKTSVMLFEQVAPQTKNPYHYYKLSLGQYQLKQIAGSEESSAKVIADTSSKNIGVIFLMEEGRQQTVPVNAAAYNLLGVMKMNAKEYAAAKPLFKKALEIFPQFEGARQNLNNCENKLKQGVTPVKTPVTKPKG